MLALLYTAASSDSWNSYFLLFIALLLFVAIIYDTFIDHHFGPRGGRAGRHQRQQGGRQQGGREEEEDVWHALEELEVNLEGEDAVVGRRLQEQIREIARM